MCLHSILVMPPGVVCRVEWEPNNNCLYDVVFFELLLSALATKSDAAHKSIFNNLYCQEVLSYSDDLDRKNHVLFQRFWSLS